MGTTAEIMAVGPFSQTVAPYLAYPESLYAGTRNGVPVLSFLYQAGFSTASRMLAECIPRGNPFDPNKVNRQALESLPERCLLGGRNSYFKAFTALADNDFKFFFVFDGAGTVFSDCARVISIAPASAQVDRPVDYFSFGWNGISFSKRLASVLSVRPWDFNTHKLDIDPGLLDTGPLISFYEIDEPDEIAAYDTRVECAEFTKWLIASHQRGCDLYFLPA